MVQIAAQQLPAAESILSDCSIHLHLVKNTNKDLKRLFQVDRERRKRHLSGEDYPTLSRFENRKTEFHQRLF